MKRMKKGFTLAEVLITLAIIGVVAAITLPTLMQDGRKQQLGAKLAKFQTNLEKITRSYAIESDISSVNDLKSWLEQEMLFNEQSSTITAGTAKELRDGTKITLPATATAGTVATGTDSKLGSALTQITFEPNVPGLDGKTSFVFVVTNKGFVVPDNSDSCLQKIASNNYKAAKIYNTTNCPKT